MLGYTDLLVETRCKMNTSIGRKDRLSRYAAPRVLVSSLLTSRNSTAEKVLLDMNAWPDRGQAISTSTARPERSSSHGAGS